MLTTTSEKLLEFLKRIKLDRVNGKNLSHLVSFASPIDNTAFDKVINNLTDRKSAFFFWQKPDEDYSFLGIDSVFTVNHYGNERSLKSKIEIEKWLNNSSNNFKEIGLNTAPLFMGGMKFSAEGLDDNSIWNDFSDSDWFIPKIILMKVGNDSYSIFNFIIDSENTSLHEDFKNYSEHLNDLKTSSLKSNEELIVQSNLEDDSEKENWSSKVNAALKQISKNYYKKVVLSRRVALELNGTPDIYEKLQLLSQEYPKCYIFAYSKSNSIFFGASPEKLAKISNGWVEADALAGSTPRGETPSEDEKLAKELLLSSKNLNEQYAVVDFIKNSFTGFADEIVYDEKPIIRKLSNIQHLWTPIKAKLKPGHTIFSILKEIHPTPAICGVPWSGALDFIKTTEGYNRGLYAGIVGWFNFEEQGEFAVSIRSGLLKNNKLYAFAGCGIVDGSDPETEFEEAELKLKPILSLFPYEKVIQS